MEQRDWKIENADGSVTVQLRKSVSIDGTEVKALRMREPTVQDQLDIQKFKGNEAQQDVQMMANLCEVSPKDLAQLSLRDYKRLQEVFLDFTE